MNYITKNDFAELAIKKHEEIDFIAKCITPWHLIGLRAFVEMLCESKTDVKGVLLIKKHFIGTSSAFLISESDIKFPSNAHVELYYEDLATSSISHKSNKLFQYLFSGLEHMREPHNVFIIQSFYQDYELAYDFLKLTDSACELVCIDEGIGSYRNRRDLIHYYFSKGIKKGVFSWLGWLLADFMSFKIKSPQQWFTILKKEKGEWVKNDAVCRWYRKVLEKCETLDIGNDKYIVVLTQPFDSEEDRKSSGAIMEALDKEIRAYQESGYKVFIKPHPRETKEIIDCYQNKGYLLFPYKGGFENILGGLNLLPECVIGLNTTSLVTAKVLFGIRSISIIKKTKASLTRGTNKTYNAFYGYFKNIVEF